MVPEQARGRSSLPHSSCLLLPVLLPDSLQYGSWWGHVSQTDPFLPRSFRSWCLSQMQERDLGQQFSAVASTSHNTVQRVFHMSVHNFIRHSDSCFINEKMETQGAQSICPSCTACLGQPRSLVTTLPRCPSCLPSGSEEVTLEEAF